VLSLCAHNAARSQMAEGLLRARHGDRFEAASAGTELSQIDPREVEALAQIGIDLSAQRSKSANEFLGLRCNLVVPLCDGARAGCSFLPGAHRTLPHAASRSRPT